MLLVVFLAAGRASAAVLRGGEHYETAASSTTAGDFYFAGDSLALSGTTTGDVLAIASRAELSGTTTGDVFLSGGEMYLAGSVAGDVRVVAGSFEHTGNAHEDMVVAAGLVHLAPGAVVEGDLVVYAERLVIEGTVLGNVEAHVRSVEVHGTIARNADIHASVSLTVLGQAKLGGLTYAAPRAAVIADSATIASPVHYTPSEEGGAGARGAWLMRFAFQLALALVFAGGVYFLAPSAAERVVERAIMTSGRSMLIGAGVLVGWPFFCGALAVTLVGAPLALLGLVVYVAGILLALAYAPLVAGVSIARAVHRDSQRAAWHIILGVVVLLSLDFLGFIGWAIRFVVLLLVLGVLAQEVWTRIRALRAPAAVHGQPEQREPSDHAGDA